MAVAGSQAMSPGRRQFVLLSSIIGLGLIASPYALAATMRRFDFEADLYGGRLIDRINSLFGRLKRRFPGFPLDLI